MKSFAKQNQDAMDSYPGDEQNIDSSVVLADDLLVDATDTELYQSADDFNSTESVNLQSDFNPSNTQVKLEQGDEVTGDLMPSPFSTSRNELGSESSHAASNSSLKRGKRKQTTPSRSVKKIDSKYEKKALGIVSLNFTKDELLNFNGSQNAFGSEYASEEEETSPETGNDETNSEGGLARRAERRKRESSRLASSNFSAQLNSSSPELALGNYYLPDDFDNNDENDAMKMEGPPSTKYFFDPQQSISVLASKPHVKPIGLLSRKGKIGAPLDVTRMPSVDDLTEEEFHICCVLRIFPRQYLKAKQVMLEECENRGFFKKSAAQKMLRMDVNKTGKLYDYFIEMGWILRQ